MLNLQARLWLFIFPAIIVMWSCWFHWSLQPSSSTIFTVSRSQWLTSWSALCNSSTQALPCKAHICEFLRPCFCIAQTVKTVTMGLLQESCRKLPCHLIVLHVHFTFVLKGLAKKKSLNLQLQLARMNCRLTQSPERARVELPSSCTAARALTNELPVFQQHLEPWCILCW